MNTGSVDPTNPLIRQAQAQDAAAVIGLLNQLADETDNMVIVRTPPEREQQVAQYLTNRSRDPHALFLLGFLDGDAEPAGCLLTTPEQHPDRRGAVEIDLGIRRAYWRRGLGQRLLAQAEAQCRAAGCHRLHLRVLVDNVAAVALYQRCGFHIEGRLAQVLHRSGQWQDQFVMAKLFRPERQGQ